MANIITSIVVTIALFLVGEIFGRVAPHLVGLFVAVASQFADSVRCKLDYLFDYHSNIKDLKDKLEKLRDERDRVDGSIEVAKGNADEIRPDVKKWLERVNEIIKETEEKFPDDEGRANGLFPNLKSRYQLSKKAKETAAEIVPKIQDGKNFSESGGVSYRAPPQGIGSTATKGYEAFESRMSTLEEVMVALKDDNVSMIWISGMGGVGKTMLVQEVARKVKEDKSFDEVVMAVVSKTPDIRKIQEEIGYQLGLGFGEKECDSQRKNRLCRRLKNENSILVILDDIWEKLDLEAVGIPYVKDHKVVLTSRNHGTLCNEMGAQKNFVVKVLSDQEGWNLFKKTAGHSANDPKLEDIAEQVAEKCANLPLAIAAVAKALKDKDLATWQDALRELKMSTPTEIIGIDREAYNCLRLSYDCVGNEAAKKLLQLCCLLPEDHHISIQDILKYGKGLGLFRGITTLEDARIKVQALVDHLKDYCLLLDGHTAGFFRIHAVFRDVGISISVASRENDILIVRNGVELREFTTKELENCLAMSLPSIDIRELPQHGEGLQCPKLQLLLWLSKDQYSLEIPDTFFKGMEQLKVLNLTNIVFSSLPSLSNLQTLCLEKSKLPDLSRIGELKNLEILSFRESDIKTLPAGIGQLTRLWLLDLSHCSDLNTIPSNVIARLSGLEELYMGNSFVKWEADGYASLDELKHLSRLVALEIGITDAKILPKEFPFKELKRYRIFVGDDWEWSGDYETSKTLSLKLNTSILQEGINMLLGSTEVLYLDELNGTSSVLYSLDREGFPHLKHLHVQKSCEIECVIKSTEPDPSKAFPELESLFLFDLINLKAICHDQLPEGSFRKLRILKVERCGSLENLFPMSVAKSLLQLQEVLVDGCDGMPLIVANNEVDKITFPQLHSLKLKCLPVLVSFCAKARTNIHSLNYAGEIIPEGEPHIPIPFFNKKVAFQNLKLLNIERCDSLRNLFSPSMANDLVKLRALKIINCQMMEEIVEKEKGVEEEAIDKIVFRLLSYITLQDLPKLTSFYPGDHTFECPSLQKLTIRGCARIKKFTSTYKGLQVTFGEGDLKGPSSPLFDEKVAFPNLEFLMIENVDSLKEIWPSQLSGHFPFQNLTSLLVTSCQNLRHIFTTSIANSLVQLQQLKIGNLRKVEEIFEKKRVEVVSMVRIVFPQLTSLHFWGLPKLNSFGQGIFISEWTSLKTLNVSGSDNVETLALELSRFQQGTTTKQPLFLVDKVAFPNLEELELSSMSNMKESWIDQFHAASFGKLTVLKVRDCDSLTHLMSLTIAKSLVQIKRIIVENCNMMKEVVASEEGKETDETTFSQLISLQLIKLPNLTSFCARSSTFSFLSLEEVLVEECPKMKTFCNGILKTPKLEKVHTQFGYRGEVFDKGIWKGDLNTTMQYMFEQKVGFLRLSKLSELKQICYDQFPVEACVVQYLVVEKCASLLNVVSSNMLECLRKLKKITVESCDSLEQVFDLEGLNYEEKHDGLLSNLEEMNLTVLPKLRCIWNKDPKGILSFRNLRWLNIHKCHNLRNLFSPSMVPCLASLEELKITKCLRMEEIIRKKKGAKEQAIDKIEFYLVYIVLQDLPNLTSFYPGNHTLRCPRLKTLKIAGCPRIKTFTGDGDVDVLSAPLFIDKVVFPCLEDLYIDSVCLKEIWHSQLPVDSFCKLKHLKLEECFHLLNIVPSNMVKMLQNVVTLSVSYCGRSLPEESGKVGLLERRSSGSIFSVLNPFTQEPGKNYHRKSHFKGHTNFRQGDGSLEYIFDLGGQNDAEGHVVQDTELSYLYLYYLPSLRHIWKMDSKGVFNFENLISVQVQLCDNLRNIFTTSIATTLKQLQLLEIESCGVEDIIGNEGVEAAATVETIVLPQLISLSLIKLEELRSFCQGNIYISEWKSLKKLVVSGCSKVKIFASKSTSFGGRHGKGLLGTPTERPLFLMDEVAFPNLEELQLGYLDRMEKIWQGQFHEPSISNLRVLIVEECRRILQVFPISSIQNLQKLEVLSVNKCGIVKDIVGEEGEEEKITDKMMLPQLTSLSLSNLGQLKSFCRGIPISEWTSLKKLTLSECKNVRIFAWELNKETGGTPVVPADQPLFLMDKVAFPHLVELELKHLSSMKEIWGGQFHAQSLCKLRVLNVEKCNEISRVFPISLLQDLQNLEVLIVSECSKLEVVFEHGGVFGEVGSVAMFPRLRLLNLKVLPKLMHLWKEDSQLSPDFQNLTTLEVSYCGNLTYLLPFAIAKSLVQIKSIIIDNCKRMKEIITIEEGEATNEITFSQLNSLVLKVLPNLTSFCRGSNTLSFPSLLEVDIEGCPELKTFSDGILNTPKLKRVWQGFHPVWKGDLNTTIQHYFE